MFLHIQENTSGLIQDITGIIYHHGGMSPVPLLRASVTPERVVAVACGHASHHEAFQ